MQKKVEQQPNHNQPNMEQQQKQQKQINRLQINRQNNEYYEQEQQYANGNDMNKQLSKKQLKKQLKKQKWQQLKKIKRKQDRQKQKLRKKQKKQQQKLNQSQQKIQEQQFNKVPMKKRKDQYIQKMQNQVRVVIDLQFYEQMTLKQQSSLAKQLAYCHSINRKMQSPFNFIITSVTNPILQFLSNQYNVHNYGIKIYQQSILDIFDHANIVYLTGDAQEEIQQFRPEEVYVIGGIVDHNRLKNITVNYARENGIKARRLPMDGVKLKASVHLAVNHVWQWMLRKYNGATWSQAITSVIPERKLQEPVAKQKIEQIVNKIQQ